VNQGKSTDKLKNASDFDKTAQPPDGSLVCSAALEKLFRLEDLKDGLAGT
jgi:hypothetical protein